MWLRKCGNSFVCIEKVFTYFIFFVVILCKTRSEIQRIDDRVEQRDRTNRISAYVCAQEFVWIWKEHVFVAHNRVYIRQILQNAWNYSFLTLVWVLLRFRLLEILFEKSNIEHINNSSALLACLLHTLSHTQYFNLYVCTINARIWDVRATNLKWIWKERGTCRALAQARTHNSKHKWNPSKHPKTNTKKTKYELNMKFIFYSSAWKSKHFILNESVCRCSTNGEIGEKRHEHTLKRNGMKWHIYKTIWRKLNTFGKRVFANAQNFCICFLQLVMFPFLFLRWRKEGVCLLSKAKQEEKNVVWNWRNCVEPKTLLQDSAKTVKVCALSMQKILKLCCAMLKCIQSHRANYLFFLHAARFSIARKRFESLCSWDWQQESTIYYYLYSQQVHFLQSACALITRNFIWIIMIDIFMVVKDDG